MTKYLDYAIVQEIDKELFEDAVNLKLDDGWQFHGTTLLVRDADDTSNYFQAFIRTVTEE